VHDGKAAERPDEGARRFDAWRPPEVAESPAAPNAAFAAAARTAALVAPQLGQPVRWRLRLLTDGVEPGAELHAGPSSCPTVDPIGRGRAITGGAVVRNLELAIANLGHEPRVRQLPDLDNPLHLATVTMGDRDDRRPDPAERLLHLAMPHRRSHPLPFARRPIGVPLDGRLHEAALRGGVRTLALSGNRLRTVGTVLAAAITDRRHGEDQLADLAEWFPADAEGCLRARGAVLIEQLSRGALVLLTTEADRPPDWLRAGWELQNAWLTAVSRGLAVSVVGGVLDAPGVRAALATRLRLDGCPQLLLRAGWPKRADPARREDRLLIGAGSGLR
jgi:hypothetical protein